MSNIQQGGNLIELVNMEFFAHHGHFEEEQIIGNKFLVTLSVETDLTAPSLSDDLKDALNYQELYNLVSHEMSIPSKLLENVAGRILGKIKQTYPAVKSAKVAISKLNPPVGGRVEASRVVMSY